MIEWLQTIGIWISRIAYCRGFGIQSPSAYRFVRYVINEHYPYYAYNELKQSVRVNSRRMLRLMRLYMRIVNYVQPDYIVDQPDRWSTSREAYYKAGSQKATIIPLEKNNNTQAENTQLAQRVTGKRVVIRIDALQTDTLLQFLPNIAHTSIIIVDGIHSSKEAHKNWKNIANSQATGVCFDLYYTGIVMMDKSKHKRCYTINY